MLPAEASGASVSSMPPSQSRSVLEVSHPLDGFLLTQCAGLLHPASDPGVRAVYRVPRPADSVARPAGTVLGTLFTPSEGFLSPAAVPRHRGRCPLVVREPEPFQPASCVPHGTRCRGSPHRQSVARLPPQGLSTRRSTSRRSSASPLRHLCLSGLPATPRGLKRRVRCAQATFPRPVRPVHPWALFLFKAFHHAHRQAGRSPSAPSPEGDAATTRRRVAGPVVAPRRMPRQGRASSTFGPAVGSAAPSCPALAAHDTPSLPSSGKPVSTRGTSRGRSRSRSVKSVRQAAGSLSRSTEVDCSKRQPS